MKNKLYSALFVLVLAAGGTVVAAAIIKLTNVHIEETRHQVARNIELMSERDEANDALHEQRTKALELYRLWDACITKEARNGND